MTAGATFFLSGVADHDRRCELLSPIRTTAPSRLNWLDQLTSFSMHLSVSPAPCGRALAESAVRLVADVFIAVQEAEVSGRSYPVGATNNMSLFRRPHLRQRRVLLKRPAGFVVTVDNPL